MSSRSVDSSRSGLRSPEGDRQLMSREHKELLRTHKADVSENMTPDDVLTRLVASGILTPKDDNKIKDKGAADNQNDLLLDMLLRKPDRAFGEFVNALRDTGQGHVAELLEPETDYGESAASSATRHAKKDVGASKGTNIGRGRASRAEPCENSDDEYLSSTSTPRKRKARTLGVRLNVSGAELEEADDEEDDILTPRRKRQNRRVSTVPRDEALTARLNEDLLEAYILETRNLKDVLREPVTQQTIAQRKVIRETLAFLSQQRRELQGVYEGSVIFIVYCPTLDSLDVLWNSFCDGHLHDLFAAAVNSGGLGLTKKYKLKEIHIDVTIEMREFQLCRNEIQSLMSVNPHKENVQEERPGVEVSCTSENQVPRYSVRNIPLSPLGESVRQHSNIGVNTDSSSIQSYYTPSPCSRSSSGVYSASGISDSSLDETNFWDEDFNISSLDISNVEKA